MPRNISMSQKIMPFSFRRIFIIRRIIVFSGGISPATCMTKTKGSSDMNLPSLQLMYSSGFISPDFGVNTVFISHFAVTDVAGNKFYFSDKADSGAYGFAGAEDNRLEVRIDENTLEGDYSENAYQGI